MFSDIDLSGLVGDIMQPVRSGDDSINTSKSGYSALEILSNLVYEEELSSVLAKCRTGL
jgi:hypothetical protein